MTSLDHTHIYVTDRYKAAEWFDELFGFKILKDFESWAQNEGPLSLSADNGFTKIALFTAFDKKPNKDYAIAFKLDKDAFNNFIQKASSMGVRNYSGDVLSSKDIIDHKLAKSIYFQDPDHNCYEVTCYEV